MYTHQLNSTGKHLWVKDESKNTITETYIYGSKYDVPYKNDDTFIVGQPLWIRMLGSKEQLFEEIKAWGEPIDVMMWKAVLDSLSQ